MMNSNRQSITFEIQSRPRFVRLLFAGKSETDFSSSENSRRIPSAREHNLAIFPGVPGDNRWQLDAPTWLSEIAELTKLPDG